MHNSYSRLLFWWFSVLECVWEVEKEADEVVSLMLHSGLSRCRPGCVIVRQTVLAINTDCCQRWGMQQHDIVCYHMNVNQPQKQQSTNQQGNIFHFRRRAAGWVKGPQGQMEILSVYLFFCDRLKVCHESDCSLCKMISRAGFSLFFFLNSVLSYYHGTLLLQLVLAKGPQQRVLKHALYFKFKSSLASATTQTTTLSFVLLGTKYTQKKLKIKKKQLLFFSSLQSFWRGKKAGGVEGV